MRRMGTDDGEGPPVPIPNTVVKLVSAEDTWLETAWENRSAPIQQKSCCSNLQQLFCCTYNKGCA